MAATTLNTLNNMKDIPQERLTSLNKESNRFKDTYGNFPFFNILSHMVEIKEHAARTTRYPQTQKDLEKKKPGILKDSSFINNPFNTYNKPERSSDRQNIITSKDKTSTIAPMTTRNQQDLPPESSLVKFYSPNGMSQTQFAFGSRDKEYILIKS